MEKNNTQTPNTETNTRENPPYYKIDHKLAVAIWTVLFEEGYEYLEKDLSRIMIEQGCQEIEVEDALSILSFWRQYLEENDLASFLPTKEQLH